MPGPSPNHQQLRLLSGWRDGSLDDAELASLAERPTTALSRSLASRRIGGGPERGG
jgi:hypothetical protein